MSAKRIRFSVRCLNVEPTLPQSLERANPRHAASDRAANSRRAAGGHPVSAAGRAARLHPQPGRRSARRQPLHLSPAVLPYVETIEMPWGARLIPVDELERLIAERRRPARPRRTPSLRGRPRRLPELVVERIQAAHTAGQTLGEIARELNADGVPTAQGGRQWWPSTVRAVLTRAGRK